MSGALSLGVIGGVDGPTAVFVTGSPAPLVIYLLAINVLAFAVYGWDKARSKVQGARRVPEKTLFLLAILGGSVGAILGMRVWHHKTRHWYFKYGLPAILLAQLSAACIKTKEDLSMKRITKQETLPALAVPEVLSVPELAYPARLGKRAVVQVLRKADVKKAALAVGGTALVLSAISAAGKRQFYKRIVASELKRQLAVVNGKLDNLQAQNEALRAELARLKQEK